MVPQGGRGRTRDVTRDPVRCLSKASVDWTVTSPTRGDAIHFNGAGAERMGRMMGEALLNNGTISSGKMDCSDCGPLALVNGECQFCLPTACLNSRY